MSHLLVKSLIKAGRYCDHQQAALGVRNQGWFVELNWCARKYPHTSHLTDSRLRVRQRNKWLVEHIDDDRRFPFHRLIPEEVEQEPTNEGSTSHSENRFMTSAFCFERMTSYFLTKEWLTNSEVSIAPLTARNILPIFSSSRAAKELFSRRSDMISD